MLITEGESVNQMSAKSILYMAIVIIQHSHLLSNLETKFRIVEQPKITLT